MSLRLSRLSLRGRRGIGELVSTFVAIPLLVFFIGLIVYAGRALYLRAALEDAAAAGARWAATSLSGAQGCRQAREAVQRALEGYYINPAPARISIQPVALWGRGSRARVSVEYDLDQSVAPVFGRLLGNMTQRVQYFAPLDSWNARHSYGWQPCQ